MADRGPQSDLTDFTRSPKKSDPTYEDASYLGTDEEDGEEVRDLGFIVEDHDDRRATLTGDWQRLDDLDTNEPLEKNRSGKIPHETSLKERGASGEWFATDYHVDHARGERQEEDFVETSMLSSDPDMEDGVEDFTDDTVRGMHGELEATDIAGHVTGVGYGFGTSLPQDLGSGGFQIRDNPLMRPKGQPISGELLSDEALGHRDVDEMGSDEELERLANQVVGSADQSGEPL